MSRALLPIAALSLVATLAPDASATCMYIPPVAMVVTKDAKVPEGGGLLVSMGYPGPDSKSKYHKLEQPTWRYRVGKKLYAPVIETLAPGLAIYRVPKGVTSAELVDGTSVLGKVTVVATMNDKPLAAPKVKHLRQESRASRKGSTVQMWADLAEKPPAEAIALVVADDKVARSFGPLALNDQSSMIVYSHAPCGIDPEGQVMSRGGETLKLYWIDRSGRVSASTSVKLEEKGSPIGLDE